MILLIPFSTPHTYRSGLITLCSMLLVLNTALAFQSDLPATEVSVETLFVIDGFLAPLGVYYDQLHNEIYVADTGNNQVAVFDAEGLPRFQIRAEQGLEAPLDVAVDGEGQIYVSQMERDSVQIFDLRGGYLADLPSPDPAGLKPGRLYLDAEGRLYAVDRGRASVLVYDAEGDFQFRFGGKGEGEGKFRLISGIAVDRAGRIYVTDSRQIPIQVFDKTGRFLLSLGRRGPREDEFAFPGGICIDQKDRLWVVDTFRHQVKVFDSDGSFLFQFGAFGTEKGKLFFPVDVALDGSGKIYVLEKGANRLQVFEIEEQ